MTVKTKWVFSSVLDQRERERQRQVSRIWLRKWLAELW